MIKNFIAIVDNAELMISISDMYNPNKQNCVNITVSEIKYNPGNDSQPTVDIKYKEWESNVQKYCKEIFKVTYKLVNKRYYWEKNNCFEFERWCEKNF